MHRLLQPVVTYCYNKVHETTVSNRLKWVKVLCVLQRIHLKLGAPIKSCTEDRYLTKEERKSFYNAMYKGD